MKQVGNIISLIEELKLDGIQNGANGVGPMGAGIAGAIKRAGGYNIQADAFRVCKKLDPQPGQAYSTISGLLLQRGIKRIIHAVTMKNPGSPSSYEIIEKAFPASIQLAQTEGIKRFGCTGLGTGIGGLDPIKVAKIMSNIAKQYSNIDIVFVDLDKDFIDNI
jgi:O-acetyl-ADP-ribose deacetylase (regulator of RNase III)